MKRRARAFTLVELLVVIGIIGLLISILLPSLGRARQAANLVDCQARLRSIGQSLQIYTVANKGCLPWGVVVRQKSIAFWIDPATSVENTPSNKEEFWWWYFTLSEQMDKNLLGPDGFVNNMSRVFRDRDVIDGFEFRYVNHYIANPRLLYQANIPDPAPAIFRSGDEIPGPQRTVRKMNSVRRPSDVFVVWDGPQFVDQAYNTVGLAHAMDSWGWYNISGLCLNPPNTSFVANRAVLPGGLGVSGRQPGQAFQKKYNYDAPKAYLGTPANHSHFRFRHMNNTRLAALCADGHVETRAAGEVMVRDVFTNYK